MASRICSLSPSKSSLYVQRMPERSCCQAACINQLLAAAQLYCSMYLCQGVTISLSQRVNALHAVLLSNVKNRIM